jgi:hypothetical protein
MTQQALNKTGCCGVVLTCDHLVHGPRVMPFDPMSREPEVQDDRVLTFKHDLSTADMQSAVHMHV